MTLKDISNRLNEWADEEALSYPRLKTDILDEIINDLGIIIESDGAWSQDSRPAPQIHFRVNVSGLKRVPDATFAIDGDIRDVDMDEFWKQRDAFQQEVDRRYPLETLAHFSDPPVLGPEAGS